MRLTSSYTSYPVPAADLAGLGAHVTLDLQGGCRLGPDTAWLPHVSPPALPRPYEYPAPSRERVEALWRAARTYLPALRWALLNAARC
jgi:L-2-hydroxyglutarate oxidase LhgO